MLHFLRRKLNFLLSEQQNSKKENNRNDKKLNNNHFKENELYRLKLSVNLSGNLDILKKVLGSSEDVITRKFVFGGDEQISAALIYLDGMVDKATVNESIMRPLMYDSSSILSQDRLSSEYVKRTMLSVGEVKQVTEIYEVVDSCLSGDTILLMDGSREALVISTKGWENRGVVDPETETIVRGPREGFTESLRINTSLLRRKIKNPGFTIETMTIGRQTKTSVCLAYIKGVAEPELIEEARRRLQRIETDAVLESGYIEEFIEDAPYSLFSTIANSERPDAVAAKLLEGRAAVLVDGTPFVLIFPMVFIESFQSPEDYYSRPYYASLVRLVRFTAFLLSILGPAIYVAVTTFHQELIPTPLLFTVVSAEEGVPFPAVIEVLVMGVIFEILREAGIRLPRPVGQAISIVGALVIGESAVSAGIIGEPVVIVIAITAVASFVVPAQTDSAAFLRLIYTLLAGAMGGLGIVAGLLGTLIHLASLRSFGTPYLSPLAPLSPDAFKDVFVRVPAWSMLSRPRSIVRHNLKRQKKNLKPRP